MKVLAIDTSCDETACAITNNLQVLSNIIWSQASLHAKFGGVMPSLAQRKHEERIDFVVDKAIKSSGIKIADLDAIAVTIGPGLSIALGVGVNKAKELAKKYSKPLIPVNHVEGHLFSSLSNSQKEISFPTLGLVLAGKTTSFILVERVGKYKILAETVDDALGEALDKAARLLGFGYPGAPVLEKIAKGISPNVYNLPVPLIGDKIKNRFSYSGLKTAFVRLFNSVNNPDKESISCLASTFQDTAFEHVIRVLNYQIKDLNEKGIKPKDLLFGGGVANNLEIRKKLRILCKENNLKFRTPYSKKLLGDNAAMIGVAAYLKYKDYNLNDFLEYEEIDRDPRLKI